MKKSLLKLLLVPLLFLSFSMALILPSGISNSDYVQLRADSTAKEEFINKLEAIINSHSVCDTTKEECDELIQLYANLTAKEKAEVNAMTFTEKGKQYTYEQAMKEIIRIYYSGSTDSSGAPKQKLDQSTTIIIAVVVSIFGMSAISVLFILKNNKYIE